MPHTYLTANVYCRRLFGHKVYKLALSASTDCPNRDGTVGVGGCVFCSTGGSGDFAASSAFSVSRQINDAKRILGAKGEGLPYIAYFQSYTGTYGDLARLEQIYTEAVEHPDIVGLSIATRPDCLGKDELAMLGRLAKKKPLWVELGLQTSNKDTAAYINRCYPLSVYEKAMTDLKALNVHRITHIILGLPNENRADMLATVKYVGQFTDGIKLQLLHVLEGTALADSYRQGEFQTLEPAEYYELVADALELLPENVVIHRLTGDGAKRDLIAPKWSGDKKRVLADLNRMLRAREIQPATE
ncbi:TIGR01212 family radical SAM protein [Scatolibacter rhodanostii]|uniref:TIGR01212 family radical SAM protein n=1 Tax=Scatolibacter rhodanostii TaxID=2014781 RepID=UPI000C0813DC|nr:TIGR01212 family radical SAM protein [Scatolibacter rhodanostii]